MDLHGAACSSVHDRSLAVAYQLQEQMCMRAWIAFKDVHAATCRASVHRLDVGCVLMPSSCNSLREVR